MLLSIENKSLYEKLLTLKTVPGTSDKAFYLALFNAYTGEPRDPAIPNLTALKKVEFLPDRVVFHGYGRKSFQILSG